MVWLTWKLGSDTNKAKGAQTQQSTCKVFQDDLQARGVGDLDENAILGGDAGSNHDSGWGGKRQRAWAGHDEHSNAEQQRKEEGVAAHRYPLCRERPRLACTDLAKSCVDLGSSGTVKACHAGNCLYPTPVIFCDSR